MNDFFKKTKVGIINDHFNLLGGGTVHSFKFIEFLKKYYDCDVYVPGQAKSKDWMRNYLGLDTEGIKIYPATKNAGERYDYMFFNISHWRAEKTSAFKKFMLVFFPQFFYPLYDYEFLANSKYTKKQIIKRWKQKKEKVHVVYPPIMTSEFKPAPQKINEIVHVSRLAKPRPEADKGHRQMIQAFKQMVDAGLKDWSFQIVGQVGEMDYLTELRNMAAGYSIKINESIPFVALKKLYSEAKIYWHLTGISMPNEPGAQEHFGMTTVEAMSSGCVPISLNSGGQREIINNGLDGFLVKDIQELKSKTLELISNKRRLKQMSESAIDKAKCFDEKVAAKKFYSIVTKTDKASIIILCWNNSQLTKECVDRLYEVTPPGFELILVDNASEDDTKQVFKALEEKYSAQGHDIKCILSKKNLGFAGGNNLGLKHATRPYVCYLNNDTLPQWNWLERMIDVLESKKDAGIVGARLYYPRKDENEEYVVQHAGVEFDKHNNPRHIGIRQRDSLVREAGIQEVEAVTAACLMTRRELAKFDERYIRGYYEDTDLCLRVRESGWAVYINHNARLIHYEGKTLDIRKKRDKSEFDKITQKNKELFHKLWDEKMKKMAPISKTIDTTGTSASTNIEIGGGEKPLYPNYAQIDLRKLPNTKYQNDARVLPFPSNSVSNIVSCYMLQCLPQAEALIALKEWHRCLRPGGKLELHVPDLNKITRMYISTKSEEFIQEIYGEQKHELDYYQCGWGFETLERLLSQANFVRVKLIKTPAHRPHALSVIAYKAKEV